MKLTARGQELQLHIPVVAVNFYFHQRPVFDKTSRYISPFLTLGLIVHRV
jgi:hypothetical protein